MRTILFAFFCICACASAVDWRPVDPAELSQKTPRVDPTADAEAVFWDVRIEDRMVSGGDVSLALIHYIRIKIFTERGKEQYSTVEIPRYGKRNIIDLAARTIKADGTVIEVKKDAIFDRELVKTKGLKVRGKTFALPNVEVGDMIEYRYREMRDGEIASHLRLYFQREIPLWSVAYHLKPLDVPWLPFAMRSSPFQCEHPPFKQEPQGFFMTSMTNMPAFKEEPNMPPEDQLRAWVLVYYQEDKKIDIQKFWKETGKDDYNGFKGRMKANDAVKRTAAELVSGKESVEDKLAALDLYCRTKIKNLNSSAFHMTAEERKAVKVNNSPDDTLKQMAGRGIDVNLLFAAMVNSLGIEARMARVTDRSDTFFTPQRPITSFIESFSVAVRSGEGWKFFDPSSPYLEAGMLRWEEEIGQALVSDPKEGFFVKTQFSEPARSKRQRQGTFTLLEDGTLEGTIQYTYTGHAARGQKTRLQDMTAAQQEEDWKQTLQSRLGAAEMSEFSIANVTDPQKPIVVRHKVSMPGYAVRTGKRILLQPAFFQRNIATRFPESKRKWDLYFDYGWAEDDVVTIDLPEGWQLDEPVAPASTPLGKIGSYAVQVQKTNDGRKLIYKRQFDWGRQEMVLIPAAAYGEVKKVFDFIHDQDAYTISLKAAPNAN